jgi:hypothetical protein
MSLMNTNNNITNTLSPRESRGLQRTVRNAEIELFHRSVELALTVQMEQRSSQAMTQIAMGSLEDELGLLEYGLARAGNSSAALELVARKVDQLSNLNAVRLARAFGV